MKITNVVNPANKDQITELLSEGPEGPIFMVNLLKFKDKAEYEDGRACDLSGRDAYMLYGREVAKLLPKFGGKAIFAADVNFLALGEADEMWDEVAIAMYPKRSDMVAMSMSEEWQAISVHRTAGLEGQINIETIVPAGAEGSDWYKNFVD